MRRVGRWMMRGVTVLSLVMCVATIVLWVRSYWWRDYLNFHREGWQHVFTVGTGFGGITAFSDDLPDDAGLSHHRFHAESYYQESYPWDDTRVRFAGFEYRHTSYGHVFLEYLESWPNPTRLANYYSRRTWTGPIALLTLLTAILPSVAIRRILRGRRPRSGNVCRACRYDLTGNVSGVCPECGKAIAA